jgi:hypothetical protein
MVHSTKGRRPSDTLWPAIRKAREQCADPWNVAEVYVRLEALAMEGLPPLIDTTTKGILWNNKGRDTLLTRNALASRLKREKRR